jgi:hypothetical protein
MERKSDAASPFVDAGPHVTGVAPSLDDEALARAGSVVLARTLFERLTLLAKKELELAQLEARADVRRGLVTGGIAGLSGVAFVSSLCCALVAAIISLSRVIPMLYAALIGACTFAVLGLGIALLAAAEGRELVPERSLRQARRTLRLLRPQSVER